MTANDKTASEAKGIKQELDNIVGFLNYAAHDLETGIPEAVTPGEDLHPHMWERLDRFTHFMNSLAIDCRNLAWSLANYLELIGVEPTEWQASVLEDLENLVEEPE